MDYKYLLNNALETSRRHKKNIISQLYELVRLRLGESKLGADDYYLYALYDDTLHTFKDKSEFIGWRTSHEIDSLLNSNSSRVYANDKIEFSIKMTEHGFKTPKILATFKEDSPPNTKINLISSTEEATNLLCDESIYPVFMKPVHGTYGRGGFSAVSVCTSSNTVQLGDDSTKTIPEIVDQFKVKWANGYIVQELLSPHSDVKTVVGNQLSSLRVIVILTEGQPHIFRVVWKLPTGNNMSDNFMHGELGNLIANVDPSNGTINNVVGKVNGEIAETDTHPDTGFKLHGVSVPLWPEVVEYCKKASLLFPGLAMQHWDIALCPEGPVALEVNVEGSVDLHQLAARKGVYNDFLKRVVNQHVKSS